MTVVQYTFCVLSACLALFLSCYADHGSNESAIFHPGQTPRFGAAAISILLEQIRQY